MSQDQPINKEGTDATSPVTSTSTIVEQPTVPPHLVQGDVTNSTSQEDKKFFFGLKKRKWYPPQEDVSDDYEQRFPEDPMLEETAANSRVWRTYLVESAVFDENMVEEARDGLDAMLVFAGLFSAVVTSFLVQTTQNLQPNSSEVSASLLVELIAVQRATAAGTSVSNVPASPLTPTSKFIPNSLDVWVNGIWVISLALGLVVALAAVLVKQWLRRYMAAYSGTSKDRSHTRHFRYIGFKKWHMLDIVGFLPVIMHISLCLFFLGLVVFLVPLHRILAYIIAVITFIVYVLYLTTNILPIFFPQCPYQTPLSDFMVISAAFAGALVPKLKAIGLGNRSSSQVSRSTRRFPRLWTPVLPGDREKSAANVDRDVLSAKALHWLFNVSSNTSVHSVVLQAIGGLPPAVQKEVEQIFKDTDVQSVYHRLLLNSTSPHPTLPFPHLHTTPGLETVAERINRATLFLPQAVQGLSHAKSIKCELSDPRLMATFVATSRHSEAKELKNLILSSYGIHHHPFVWMSIIRSATKLGLFSDFQTDAKLFSILYPAIWGINLNHNPCIPPKMAKTIYLYMHEEFWGSLLNSLLPLACTNTMVPSSLATSSASKVLMLTLDVVLSRASSDPTLEGSCWGIIHKFLELNPPYHLKTLEIQPMLGFFTNWIELLVEKTHICEYNAQPSQVHLEIRHRLLNHYSVVIMKGHDLIKDPKRSQIFCRAIEGYIQELSLNPTTDTIKSQYSIAFVILFQALRVPSSLNCVAAYQLFLQYDCLDLIGRHFPKMAQGLSLAFKLITAYIAGLNGNVGLAARDRDTYIDYLYDQFRLKIVVLSLISGPSVSIPSHIQQSSPSLRRSEPFEDLLKLRPDDTVWIGLRNWLCDVFHWLEQCLALDVNVKMQSLSDQGLVEPWMEVFLWEAVVVSPYGYLNLQQMVSWLNEISAGFQDQ